MNHFVVIVPYCSAEWQNALTGLFKQRGFAWWHWCAECWLLATNDASLDAAGVRSIAREVLVNPLVAFLVLRVDPPPTGINWAATGTLLGAQGWGHWLRESWEHPDWKP